MFFIFIFSAVVHGRVTDAETQEPLPACNVYILGKEIGTSTDEGGFYRLQNIAPGSYTIVFSMIGYKEKRKSVKIKKEDEVISLDIKLRMEPLKVEKVIISAKREEFKKEIGTSSYKVSSKWARKLPAFIERDIFRMVQTLPGITFVSDFSSALYIRGGTPDQNLFLLDMVDIFNPFHFGGFFSTFPVESVENLSFYTGNFPARYGGRLSSVLDVKTYEGGKKGLHMTQSILASEVFGEYFLEKLSLAGAGRRTYFDKILPLIGINFPYYFYDLIFSGKYSMQNLKVGGTFFKSADEFSLSVETFSLYFKWEKEVEALRLKHTLSKEALLSLWTGKTLYTTHFLMEGFMEVQNKIEDKIVRGEFLYLKEPLELHAGFERHSPYFWYDVWSMNVVRYDVEGPASQWSLYIGGKQKISEIFIFQGALRLNHYSIEYTEEKSYSLISPRIAFKYFINASNAVTLSAGAYHQFYGMVLPEGGRIPVNFWLPVFDKYPPQKVYQMVLGYQRMENDGKETRVEIYYKDYPTLLMFNERFDPFDVSKDIFLKGTGRAYGADILYKKPVGRVTGWISYSLGWSFFSDDTATYYSSFDRRHVLNIIGEYRLGNNTLLSIKWTFASGNPYTEAIARRRIYYFDPVWDEVRYRWFRIRGRRNAKRFPPYHRLDIGISKGWEKDWGEVMLRLDILNLYNHKNVFLYYYDYTKEPPIRREVSMIPIFPSIGLEVKWR